MAEKKEPTFESALARLEEIVKELETGSAPLDKSLSMFEEGIGLVKLCGDKLDSAEQKIKMLVKNEDGEYVEQDFAKAGE